MSQLHAPKINTVYQTKKRYPDSWSLQSIMNVLGFTFVIILVCSLPSAIVCDTPDAEQLQQFTRLARQYSRPYATMPSASIVETHYYKNFLNNLKVLKFAQENDPQAKFELNQFFDMSEEEFTSTKLMPTRDIPANDKRWTRKEAIHITPRNDLPHSFDWREHGRVNRVNNQESCGSCYAFSALQAIDGAFVGAGGNLTEYSVQAILACDQYDCECRGGWPYRVYDWLIEKRFGIVPTEKEYPYCVPPIGNCFPCGLNETFCGKRGYCNYTCPLPETTSSYDLITSASNVENPNLSKQDIGKVDSKRHLKNSPRKNPTARIFSWIKLPEDETSIAQFLLENGPISIALNAMYFQFYSSGISDPWWCPVADLNHAVLLVGFSQESGLFGTKKYWIIKNSWGEEWGMKGYMHLVRGKGSCGMNKMAVFPLVEGVNQDL